MVDYRKGQIVRSIAGRDKNDYFIVIDLDDVYLYLVDGKSRRVELPKQKKKKHVQITHTVAQEIDGKLHNGDKITNADIRNSLKFFKQNLDR